MPFFDLDEDEQRSFWAVVRHTVLEGELRLVRFSDSSRGHEGAFGKWNSKTSLYQSYWMYASEVEEILWGITATGPYGMKTIAEVSRRWAICDDWGDLGRTWVMKIPAGWTLHAYFGFTKFQPKISTKTQASTGRTTTNSYPGGSIQLVTRIGEQEQQWISGPIPTLALSPQKLVNGF
jgi:hypothetical protein